MNCLNEYEAFVSHREVARYENANGRATMIMAIICIGVALLIYKSMAIYICSLIDIILVATSLCVIKRHDIKMIFLSEGLQTASIILSISTVNVALLLYINGYQAATSLCMILIIWIVTASGEMVLIKRKIQICYYSNFKQFVTSSKETIPFIVLPGCFLAYEIAEKVAPYLILEAILVLMIFLIRKMMESFLLNHYVNKYGLESSIRVGNIRT